MEEWRGHGYLTTVLGALGGAVAGALGGYALWLLYWHVLWPSMAPAEGEGFGLLPILFAIFYAVAILICAVFSLGTGGGCWLILRVRRRPRAGTTTAILICLLFGVLLALLHAIPVLTWMLAVNTADRFDILMPILSPQVAAPLLALLVMGCAVGARAVTFRLSRPPRSRPAP